MPLDIHARAVGRKVGDDTWIVALRNLVSDAPVGLADVEVEVDPTGAFVVALEPSLLTEARGGWWRDLEADARPTRDPEEAELLASVIACLPWHPRKQRILRRLEDPLAATAPRPQDRSVAPRRRAAAR